MEIPEKPDPILRLLPMTAAKCLGCRFMSSICKLRSTLLPNEDTPVRMLLIDPRFCSRRETYLPPPCEDKRDVSDKSIWKSRSSPILRFIDEDPLLPVNVEHEPVCKLLIDPRFVSGRETNDMSSCGDISDSPVRPVMMLL